MAGERRVLHIPEPAPETIAGVLQSLDRISVVVTALQQQFGDRELTMTTMERNIEDMARSHEGFRRLLQGETAEQSLPFRTLMLERGQQAMAQDMKDHRQEVKGYMSEVGEKIERLSRSAEEAAEQQRVRSWQFTLAFFGILANLAVALLLLLLKH